MIDSLQYPELSAEERWQQIRAAVEAQGTTMSAIGVAAGVRGINAAKRRRYPAAQEAIASFLNSSPAALFPDRYDVVWNDVLQREAEQALPGLRGENTVTLARLARLQATQNAGNAPVSLESLPTEGQARLKWIKAQLRARGFHLVDIAAQLQVKRSAINNLATVAYAEIQDYLASCLGVSAVDLWPERYDDAGNPVPTGSCVLASPHRASEPYHLDLRDGLWLPVAALVDLPGMPASVAAIRRLTPSEPWLTRVRQGVEEALVPSLPTVTQRHLMTMKTSNQNVGDTTQRARRRKDAFELTLQTRSHLDVTVMLRLSASSDRGLLQLQKVASDECKITCLEAAELEPDELRKVANKLIEIAQTLEPRNR